MSTAGTTSWRAQAPNQNEANTESMLKGKIEMPQNREMQGLAMRHHVVDFALLIGGAVATACAVAAVAMALVLLVAR